MKAQILHHTGRVRGLPLAAGGFILAAWGSLAGLQQSAYAGLLGHEAAGMTVASPLLQLGSFLAGWLLMTVAMMLPASLPQLDRAARPTMARTGRTRYYGLAILGYLGVWLAFGLLVYLGDSGLHRLSAAGRPLAGYDRWIAPLIVLAVGVYQFSPFKRRALLRCQAPAPSLVGAARWLSSLGAVRLGLQLGKECLTICGSLMLLMAAVGHNRLDAMIVLSGLMLAERHTPWGGRLAQAVGAALIAGGVVWLFAAASAGHNHLH